jgi:hypothetical protein
MHLDQMKWYDLVTKPNNPPSPHALDLERVRAAVQSTGFNLEYQVSEQFRKAGWSVINNKYYIDDIAHSVREIDLIAYKAEKVGPVHVYTTLIVSCKKSDTNVWALLSKPLRLNDPNIDWHPQHAWSNYPQIDHMLTKTDWVSKYILTCRKDGIYSTVVSPNRHVFAFQEINKSSYTCQNDANIFNSVSSLMKAQGYELGALKVRKRSPVVYMFSLMSVVDAPLVRIDYTAQGAATAELIDDDRYIGSYIINQKEIAARIHFVTAVALPKLIAEYDKLHACNGSATADLIEDFYNDVLLDDDRASVLDSDFNRAISYKLNRILSEAEGPYKSRQYKARKSSPSGPVEVYGADYLSEASILNAASDAKIEVTKALEKVYQYQGPWSFESEIPF